MRFDPRSAAQAEQEAFELLASPRVNTTEGLQENEFYTLPKNITNGVTIVQELPYVNTQQVYTFDFSLNQPQPTTVLNNSTLKNSETACCYAIKFLIGNGATANNRLYRSYGPTTNDDAIYNGKLSWEFESNKYIQDFDMGNFYDNSPNLYDTYSGMYLLRPKRLFKGFNGTNKVEIKLLNPITSLTLTSNLYLSMRLVIVKGAAKG